MLPYRIDLGTINVCTVNICELLCALLADSLLKFLYLSSLLSMFQNEGMGVPVVVMWL